jgi:hypothetical protein
MTTALWILGVLIFAGLLAISPGFRSVVGWLAMGVLEILKNLRY